MIPEGTWFRAGALLAAAGLVAAACSGGSAQKVSPASGAAVIADPLATSVDTSYGPWATTAMGDLSEPLNTFWQLFHRPAGRASWSDDVEATATATNGGLVLAAQGATIEVGILTSQDLTFSPVIASADGGKTWRSGVLPASLLARPDSMALDSAGQTIAALGSKTGTQVVTGGASLGSWQALTDEGLLAVTPAGRACDLSSIESVGWLGSTPLVGASCSQPGVVGVLADRGGAWIAAVPRLPQSLSGDTASVLRIYATAGGGEAVLVGLAGPGGDSLMAGWYSSAGGWTFSGLLRLPSPNDLDSAGLEGPTGLFALVAEGRGQPSQLHTVDGPGQPWISAPTSPAGTATVVAPAQGVAEQALTGSKTVMTAWTLTSKWAKSQSLPVTISFGSSD